MSKSHRKTQELGDAVRFLLIGLVVLAAAGIVERTVVPDIVPVAFAESPQPLWAVELSFLLRSVELVAGSVSLSALGAAIAIAIRNAATDPARQRTIADRPTRI